MTKHIPKIVSALWSLALVGAGVYLIVAGHELHGAGLIAGGVGTAAIPRFAERRAQ